MQSRHFKTLATVLAVAMLAAAALSQTVVNTAQSGGHWHGRGFGARMFGLNAHYLELTDAQQAQMKDILTKEKPTIRPLFQQLAQGRQQMSQLEQAARFDEATVRTLATQQSQTMTELMVQKARIKSELLAVLTPDQKTKLAQREARRQARIQQHLQQQGQATTAQ